MTNVGNHSGTSQMIIHEGGTTLDGTRISMSVVQAAIYQVSENSNGRKIFGV